MMGDSSRGPAPALNLRTVQVLLWDVLSPKIRTVERDEVSSLVSLARFRRARPPSPHANPAPFPLTATSRSSSPRRGVPTQRNRKKNAKIELVLGSLVEENLALFEEANTLGSILEDLEVDIREKFSKRKLIDTPARAMLERDLRKVLGALKFTMCPNLLSSSSFSSKEKKVLEYLQATATRADSGPGPQAPSLATTAGGHLQRPYTPRSRPASSCSTSSRPSSAGSSGSLASFALPDVYSVLQQVESKLNVFDIDAIAPVLKQVLHAEHETLLEDIDYLQDCLQDKGGEMSAGDEAPPTMTDLKDFGKTLQGVERMSQVDKLLDVSNRPAEGLSQGGEQNFLKLHQTAVSTPDTVLPPPPLSLDPLGGPGTMMPPHPPSRAKAPQRLAPPPDRSQHRHIPRAPPTKPGVAPSKPPSSRARKLRGIVSENRRLNE